MNATATHQHHRTALARIRARVPTVPAELDTCLQHMVYGPMVRTVALRLAKAEARRASHRTPRFDPRRAAANDKDD
jgi:hypothetical protein